MALAFLRVYDHVAMKQLFDDYGVGLKPFGAVVGNCINIYCNGLEIGRTSDYDTVMKRLTSLSAIPKLIKEMKKCHQLIPMIRRSAFVEIKRESTAYTFYPWQHQDHDWHYGKKFKLTNCQGKITATCRPFFFYTPNIQDLLHMQITETRNDAQGTSSEIMHILCADQITDAASCDGCTSKKHLFVRNMLMHIQFYSLMAKNIAWNILHSIKKWFVP